MHGKVNDRSLDSFEASGLWNSGLPVKLCGNSGAARIFYWRGKTGWGWGGAPENFSWTKLSTLAVNATNTPFMD